MAVCVYIVSFYCVLLSVASAIFCSTSACMIDTLFTDRGVTEQCVSRWQDFDWLRRRLLTHFAFALRFAAKKCGRVVYILNLPKLLSFFCGVSLREIWGSRPRGDSLRCGACTPSGGKGKAPSQGYTPSEAHLWSQFKVVELSILYIQLPSPTAGLSAGSLMPSSIQCSTVQYTTMIKLVWRHNKKCRGAR